MSPANLFTVTCHTKWSRSGQTDFATTTDQSGKPAHEGAPLMSHPGPPQE